MEAKTIWKGKLSFTGKGDSGHEIPLGASSGIGGDDDGLRPMDFFALVLAGCTVMVVISILQKKTAGNHRV